MVDAGLANRAGVTEDETPSPGSSFLVVGPAWVGDMVMAQCLFKALASKPGNVVDVVAPAWTLPLLYRMPEVRKSFEAPFQSGKLQLKRRYELAQHLSKRRYDQAIVLPNSWKSALVPFLAGIPVRSGFLGEHRWGLINDVRKLDKTALPMTVQRFVELARSASGPVTTKEELRPKLVRNPSAQRDVERDLGIALNGAPVIALCPGAEYGPSKQWPSEYFAQTALKKLSEGWHVWLLGSAGDTSVAAEINALCSGQCLDLTGQTTLGQAMDLLSLATVVVSNDSGLMHVAAAFEAPLVALFGSTDPKHTPPLSRNCEILYRGLSCSPCFERQCPLKHLDCLRQITPDHALTSIDRVLQ
ncbi:MAG: lipopolysaccharide heptosyltransferase II [Arenicellales bacterium]|nr:lipopolysaccharide heptosyltransferase II [Arenicellales bacterium]